MASLRYAYNTNGCAHHRLEDAIDLIAKYGYDGVALTLDWHHLGPLSEDWQASTYAVHRQLQQKGLSCVIETGARFLLDPTEKHEPTFVSRDKEEREIRLDFLKRAVDIGALLHAETVSFWAGKLKQDLDKKQAFQQLGEGVVRLMDYADNHGVSISLEPEPGMLIETNADFERLVDANPTLQDRLLLALDLGHVWVTGESAPSAAIHKYADRLGTISIEGMNAGQHLHLPLDQGDMEISPLLKALKEINFQRLVCVELSRESPRAHEAIPHSIQLLKDFEAKLA